MIEFKNVKKVYPNGTVALDGVDLKIADGEFVFIVGASGAGKSTLTKLLTREEKITEGELTVDEFDLVKMPNRKIPYYRRGIGVVFQDFRLLHDKTVYENVAFAMEVVGESRKNIKRIVPRILTLVGLQDKSNSFPDQLSGGEQQRVALARALANNPKTIIAVAPHSCAYSKTFINHSSCTILAKNSTCGAVKIATLTNANPNATNNNTNPKNFLINSIILTPPLLPSLYFYYLVYFK